MAAQAKPIFVQLIVDEEIQLRSRCPRCTRAIRAEDIAGQITHKLNNHVLYEIPPGAVTVEDVMVALQEELTILRGFQIFLGKFMLLPSVGVKVFELNQGVFSIKLLPDCEELYTNDSMSACSSRWLLTSTPIRHNIASISVDTMDISDTTFHEDADSLIAETSTKSEIPSSMPGENLEEIQSSSSSTNESLGVLLPPLLPFNFRQSTSDLVSSDVDSSENLSEIVVSAEKITKKRTLLDADADSMPSASMLNDATPLPSISTPNKKPKLVSSELKSNYSDSDGEKVKGSNEKAIIVGAKREMIWKGWHPLSTLDRENVPLASYLHFRYTMKGKTSGQGDQEIPVLMVFDSFICTPDGDNAIRGAVIEDIDDLSINYDEKQIFKVKNIRIPLIYK